MPNCLHCTAAYQVPGYVITDARACPPNYSPSPRPLPQDRPPDFGTITINSMPTKDCIELEASRCIPWVSRLGIFYENAVNKILRDIVPRSIPSGASSAANSRPPRRPLHLHSSPLASIGPPANASDNPARLPFGLWSADPLLSRYAEGTDLLKRSEVQPSNVFLSLPGGHPALGRPIIPSVPSPRMAPITE